MTSRLITPDDIIQLREIWENFYKNEFEFPDFSKFCCSYIIEDDIGILTAGGIRLLAESILITDKNRGKFARFKALQLALDMNKYFCKEAELGSIHAFIQNPKWQSQLIKQGFVPTKGNALVHME